MQTGGLGFILGILLALVLALGSFAGIDTSQLEDTASDYGIVPIELSDVLDSLGSGLGLSDSLGGSEDDLYGDTENPVTNVETAQDAADGAGVGSFVDLEALELSFGKVSDYLSVYYVFEEGMASGIAIYDDVLLTVDKSTLAYTGDLFAIDSRDFSLEWSQTIDGIEVECFGYNQEGVGKAIFTDGTYMYGITAVGLGDQPEYGLSIADLTVLIDALVK